MLLKDFALDPDEQGLRRATHHMIRAMTAGMAAITCRDPLSTTLQGYLKQAFLNSLHGASISAEQVHCFGSLTLSAMISLLP